MKRIYDYNYLIRREGSHRAMTEWCNEYCHQLCEKTNVKWVYDIAPNANYGSLKVRFNPVLWFKDIESVDGDLGLISDKIREIGKGRLFGTVSFGELSEALPDLELVILMGMCKSLVVNKIAHLHVNRQGRPTMINLSK